MVGIVKGDAVDADFGGGLSGAEGLDDAAALLGYRGKNIWVCNLAVEPGERLRCRGQKCAEPRRLQCAVEFTEQSVDACYEWRS